MRPQTLILSAGFVALVTAYLSPLISDPTLQRVAWSVCITAAIAVMEGWRRARTYNPRDYS
jgi:hypothetical protein